MAVQRPTTKDVVAATEQPIVDEQPQPETQQSNAEPNYHTGNPGTTAPNFGYPDPQPTPSFEQPNYQQQGTPMEDIKALSVATIVSDFGGVLGDASTDADTNKVKEIFDEIVKENAEKLVNVKVTPISVARTGNFSAVAVHEKQLVGGKPMIAMHIFLMESSRPPLDPLVENDNNRQIETTLAVADAADINYLKNVGSEIKSVTGNSTAEIVCAGTQTIYRETSLDKATLYKLLGDGLNSIKNYFVRLSGSRNHFTLEGLTKDGRLRVNSRVTLGGLVNRDNGIPVRSDIITELSIIQNQGNQQNPVGSHMGTSLAKASAYTDLIYMPPTQQQFGFNGGFGAPIPPHYLPRIVITDLSTQMAVDPLNALLLSIANITALERNRAYGIQWRDSYNRNSTNQLRDFGAVGYQIPAITEAKQPGPIIIDSDSTLKYLMDITLMPTTVYSIDIEQSVSNSWLLGVFSRAAQAEGQAFNELIYNSANTLTNGKFEVLYCQALGNVTPDVARKHRILRDRNDQQHIGYYVQNNERHDLREIDLIAFLNISKGDPDAVRDYLSTLYTEGEHHRVRLDRRLRIFRQFLPDIHVKGYASRLDFDAKFIQALIQAVISSNLAINATNQLLNQNQTSYNQTIQDWSGQVVTGGINLHGNMNQPFNSQYANIGSQTFMGGLKY